MEERKKEASKKESKQGQTDRLMDGRMSKQTNKWEKKIEICSGISTEWQISLNLSGRIQSIHALVSEVL